MKSVEQLAVEIQLQFEKDGEPVTYQEAFEMAQMEIKEKGIRRYEREALPKAENAKKKPRTVKISAEKEEIFNFLRSVLNNSPYDYEILTDFKLFSIKIGDKKFKLDLIQQRK